VSTKGVLHIIIIVEGACSKYMCCGAIGTNGARFYAARPAECGYKCHVDNKADVAGGHIYLGTKLGE
jgi:hypothetical protein